jgi:hypothetical protein
MHFRDHPMMVYKGLPIWPPHWIWIVDPDKSQEATDEVGILENAQFSRVLKSTIFLTIATVGGNRYMACLNLDDEQFCSKVL